MNNVPISRALPVQRFTNPTGVYAVGLLGTGCPVPAKATPATLAAYYTTAKVAKILGGFDALNR